MATKLPKATGTASAAQLRQYFSLDRIDQIRFELERKWTPEAREELRKLEELTKPLYEAWYQAVLQEDE